MTGGDQCSNSTLDLLPRWCKLSVVYLDPLDCAIQLGRQTLPHLLIAAELLKEAGNILIFQLPLLLCNQDHTREGQRSSAKLSAPADVPVQALSACSYHCNHLIAFRMLLLG